MERSRIVTVGSDLQRKIAHGQAIIAEDVENAAAIAATTQRPEHFMLYADIKARLLASIPEVNQPEPPVVTVEQVKAARDVAKDNPSVDNMTRFSTLKQQYEQTKEAGV